MKWNIVVDSSSDLLSTDIQSEYADITIVPLHISVGDKEYIDDDNINIDDMLASMKATKEAAKTACPSAGDFLDAYKKGSNTICFTISGALSGTYNAARLARNMLREENPLVNVSVFDTKSTGGSLALCIKETIKYIEQGLSFSEVTEKLEKYNQTNKIIFSLECFDNMVKTGRMSGLLGTIASKLNIHVIATNSELGEAKVIKKVHGYTKSISGIIEEMEKFKDCKGKDVYISHCNNLKAATDIKNMALEKLQVASVTILKCKGLTSFYAMDGGILVTF